MRDLREQPTRTSEMRKLLMPTLGDNLGAATAPDQQVHGEFRELLPQTPGIGTPLLRASFNPTPSPRASSLPPGLIALIHSIVSDLEARSNALLGLNPSRRDAICAHLNALAQGAGRPNLPAWLSSQRTANESRALFSYFEEIALMAIGQSILLKRWSDRGLRPFRAEHLGKLNFELSTALRPHVPLHREGFHLTRPNLYSWYSPPAMLQEELFRTLETIDFRDESPAFVLELCSDGRRFSPDWPELLGYDPRFYQEVSNELLRWSQEARTSSGRRKIGYTPTLRLGQVSHGNTTEIQWLGCEENTFALLISEMIDLWWGPKAPPVWSNSNSLEAHPKEQLPLVAPGLKPGVLSMLSDMEACDFGWVAEERLVKASKSKVLLDSLPFYRKLRAPGTHLGTLQACIAITKIRPGGRLIWVREEPLTGEEGSEALSFLLGRSKLLAEISLSHVEHSLPTRRPLFPRYIYVFERELKHEDRLAHRPTRWIGQGAIKSHVEIPLFLSDVLAAINSGANSGNLPNRTHWKLTAQVSPLPQKDWMTRWPDPSCAESLSNLEALSRGTVPLATLATIRSVKSIDTAQAALFIEPRGEPRRLAVKAFRDLVPGLEYSGFAVLLPDASWVDPMRAYLENAKIALWLEHHAERRGDRWILSESLLKMLPISERFARTLAHEGSNLNTSPELRELVLALSKNPASVSTKEALSPELRFIAMSLALSEVERASLRIRPYLNGEGKIEWTKVLELLRSSDSVPLTQHPLVRIVGQIQVHTPLTKIDRLKSPQNGMLLMTESGSLQKVVFDHRMLADMAWDQVKVHAHPTWGELVQTIRLPRSLEIAESAAGDILSSHQDLSRKRAALLAWLSGGIPELS